MIKGKEIKKKVLFAVVIRDLQLSFTEFWGVRQAVSPNHRSTEVQSTLKLAYSGLGLWWLLFLCVRKCFIKGGRGFKSCDFLHKLFLHGDFEDFCLKR